MSNHNKSVKCVKPSEPDPEELYQRFIGYHNHHNDVLFSENTINTEGVWHVFGDDPNCDFGGSHHTPDLGYFEGRLGDVIRHAVTLPKFWAWGPGRIVKEGPRSRSRSTRTPVGVSPKPAKGWTSSMPNGSSSSTFSVGGLVAAIGANSS